jgi:tetratricopeptide (TPR) repeat protein
MSAMPIEARLPLVLQLLRAERWEEAELSVRAGLVESPQHVELHHQLAIALWRQGHIDAAHRAFEQVLRLQPEHRQALANASLMLAEAGGPPGSLALCQAAVRAHPGNPDLLNNLGIVQFAEGQLKDSIASYDAALRLAPDSAVARYNRNFPRLLLGDFRGHCEDYEQRFAGSGMWPTGSPEIEGLPLWRGEALAGRNLLVHAEQGFGDTFQYIRFLPLLAGLKPARLTVHVQPEVLPALDSLRYFAELHPVGTVIGPCHFSIPLMSLPHRLGLDWKTLPAWSPYLAPRPERVAYWKRRLAEAEQSAPAIAGTTLQPFRVGLVWRGASANQRDRERSLSLRDLHLLALPGVRFVSLQKGPAEAEARDDEVLRPLPLGEELVDFADTAALISQLDLVVTVDTAVAHLSGALGHPTWVLTTPHDSKWLATREDSPWYPSVQLFRQLRRGEWKPALLTLAYALQQRVRQRDAAAAPSERAGPPEGHRALRDAVQMDPTNASHHLSLGQDLLVQQRVIEAVCCLRHALALDPGLMPAHRTLARLLRARGAIGEALSHHDQVLAQAPDSATDLAEYARCSIAGNDPLRALRSAQEALDHGLAAESAEMTALVARSLGLLTDALPELQAAAARWQAAASPANAFALAEHLLDLGLPLPAIAFYRHALQTEPSVAVLRGLSDCLVAQEEWAGVLALQPHCERLAAHDLDLRCDQATALWKLGRLDEAEARFAGLLATAPAHLTANLHGSALALVRGQLDLAAERAQQTLVLAPERAEAHLAVAAVAERQGAIEVARNVLRNVLKGDPGHALARLDLAILDLREGRWAEGWAGYEARTDAEGVRRYLGARGDQARRWQGEDLAGQHLVVCSEQGFGDTLQFLRFLPALGRLQPARVTLQVQDPLVDWLRRAIWDGRFTLPGVPVFEVMPRTLPLPPYQCFVPLLSLPGVLGAGPAGLPPPWLPAPPEARRAHWRGWLAERSGLAHIGVCWSGNPAFIRDHERSPGLAAVAGIFAASRCDFVSLQYGASAELLADHPLRVPTLAPALGMGDSAALIAELELVITSDTSIAHLAAGLGRPTWLLLPLAADWRWGPADGRCLWYPEVRQFRQPASGDWASVAAAVRAALESGRA